MHIGPIVTPNLLNGYQKFIDINVSKLDIDAAAKTTTRIWVSGNSYNMLSGLSRIPSMICIHGVRIYDLAAAQ